MEEKLVKPRELAKQLKKKLEKIKTKLPTNWRVLFIHDNPEYEGQQQFLGNVITAKSMHEPTILKIEGWVETLKKKSQKK